MEWRILKTNQGVYAELGMPNNGENHNPFIVSQFIVYESHRFDTEKQAHRYIEKRGRR